MTKTKDLAIVMPVYNEAEIIGKVVEKWTAMLDKLNINYEFNLYNDGSKDNTAEILAKLSANYPKLNVHNKPNSGHGPTILLGYRNASTTAEWIFQTDSDDELSPDSFPTLWNNRTKYDFLIGIRTERNTPLVRQLISLISRLTVWIFYGRKVYDVNSPYRLMRSECLNEVFGKIPQNTFAPNLIIAGMASKLKLRVFSIKISYEIRKTGTVSIKKWKLMKAAFNSLKQTVNFRFS